MLVLCCTRDGGISIFDTGIRSPCLLPTGGVYGINGYTENTGYLQVITENIVPRQILDLGGFVLNNNSCFCPE